MQVLATAIREEKEIKGIQPGREGELEEKEIKGIQTGREGELEEKEIKGIQPGREAELSPPAGDTMLHTENPRDTAWRLLALIHEARKAAGYKLMHINLAFLYNKRSERDSRNNFTYHYIKINKIS